MRLLVTDGLSVRVEVREPGAIPRVGETVRVYDVQRVVLFRVLEVIWNYGNGQEENKVVVKIGRIA